MWCLYFLWFYITFHNPDKFEWQTFLLWQQFRQQLRENCTRTRAQTEHKWQIKHLNLCLFTFCFSFLIIPCDCWCFLFLKDKDDMPMKSSEQSVGRAQQVSADSAIWVINVSFEPPTAYLLGHIQFVQVSEKYQAGEIWTLWVANYGELSLNTADTCDYIHTHTRTHTQTKCHSSTHLLHTQHWQKVFRLVYFSIKKVFI